MYMRRSRYVMLLGVGWPCWSPHAVREEPAKARPAPAALRRNSRRVGREAPSFGVRWLPPWKICGRSLLRPWRARIVERLLEWQAGGTKGQPKRYDRCTTRRQSVSRRNESSPFLLDGEMGYSG